jgi:hypothetical protein
MFTVTWVSVNIGAASGATRTPELTRCAVQNLRALPSPGFRSQARTGHARSKDLSQHCSVMWRLNRAPLVVTVTWRLNHCSQSRKSQNALRRTRHGIAQRRSNRISNVAELPFRQFVAGILQGALLIKQVCNVNRKYSACG